MLSEARRRTKRAREAILKENVDEAYLRIMRTAEDGNEEVFFDNYGQRGERVMTILEKDGFNIEKIGGGWIVSWKE